MRWYEVPGIKRMMVATALAVVAAVAGQAHAFSHSARTILCSRFTGNNTEALYNLGDASLILAPGEAGICNLNVSAGLAAASAA